MEEKNPYHNPKKKHYSKWSKEAPLKLIEGDTEPIDDFKYARPRNRLADVVFEERDKVGKIIGAVDISKEQDGSEIQNFIVHEDNRIEYLGAKTLEEKNNDITGEYAKMLAEKLDDLKKEGTINDKNLKDLGDKNITEILAEIKEKNKKPYEFGG